MNKQSWSMIMSILFPLNFIISSFNVHFWLGTGVFLPLMIHIGRIFELINLSYLYIDRDQSIQWVLQIVSVMLNVFYLVSVRTTFLKLFKGEMYNFLWQFLWGSFYLVNLGKYCLIFPFISQSNLNYYHICCSLWDYTNVVMNFLCNPKPLDGSASLSFDWLQYFDVVITGRSFFIPIPLYFTTLCTLATAYAIFLT